MLPCMRNFHLFGTLASGLFMFIFYLRVDLFYNKYEVIISFQMSLSITLKCMYVNGKCQVFLENCKLGVVAESLNWFRLENIWLRSIKYA